jgi:hypothetical protein
VKSTHIFTFLGIIGLTALFGGNSAADLASPLYQAAKTLYNNSNCSQAKDALTKYKISDPEWLRAHPDRCRNAHIAPQHLGQAWLLVHKSR